MAHILIERKQRLRAAKYVRIPKTGVPCDRHRNALAPLLKDIKDMNGMKDVSDMTDVRIYQQHSYTYIYIYTCIFLQYIYKLQNI